jgi:choline dehydrogenase-like flavoprotein
MVDAVIVGSGASAIAAAMELSERGIVPLMLDVGVQPPDTPPVRGSGSLYDYKAVHDSFELTIGGRYQGLSNLIGPGTVPVKLTTPNAEYVTRGARTFAPIDESGFCAIQSFAMGGLANAWGAGLYRFDRADLDGFPIGTGDLDPYFDKLTAAIGISGADDDLAPCFGSTKDLLPPIRLSHNIESLYRAYRRKRPRLPAAFQLGRARIAALTRPFDGRPPVEYDNFEFWQEHPSLYSPRSTLEKLIAEGRVHYRRDTLVQSFAEGDAGVTVHAVDPTTGARLQFECGVLLVAAGVINTSKIVLQSFDDYETRLPLLENPAIQIPFVLPRSIGRALDTTAFGLVQLNLIWDSQAYGARCQGSLMEITSPLRAEFFASLPYAARANLSLMRHLLPSMVVMQVYLPGDAQHPHRLRLQENGRLRIDGHPSPFDLRKAGPLLRFMRALGAWTHRALVVSVPMGHAIHYAGTLPMRRDPGRYECGPDGLLCPLRRVYVADSASLTRLPAKNMSFGMMANAMRVAAAAAGRLGEAR